MLEKVITPIKPNKNNIIRRNSEAVNKEEDGLLFDEDIEDIDPIESLKSQEKPFQNYHTFANNNMRITSTLKEKQAEAIMEMGNAEEIRNVFKIKSQKRNDIVKIEKNEYDHGYSDSEEGIKVIREKSGIHVDLDELEDIADNKVNLQNILSKAPEEDNRQTQHFNENNRIKSKELELYDTVIKKQQRKQKGKEKTIFNMIKKKLFDI